MNSFLSIWICLISIFFGPFFIGEISAESNTPFRQALPGYNYQFPRDFYSHDDFKIEWWYYTGNLQEPHGKRFGYQLTFFRVGIDSSKHIKNPSQWKINQIFFAHMTVTDIASDRFYFFERINRKGLGNAGARSDRLLVWNEDWILTQDTNVHHLKALQSGTGIDLLIVPTKQVIIHGKEGISQKGGEGNASHYFSYTRMRSEGQVWIRGKNYSVTGTSWMDHEFSSNQLNEQQIGWDWFSIKLNNKIEIMLYQIRLKNGGIEPSSNGTLVEADGSYRALALKDFQILPKSQWISKKTHIKYPSGWKINLPSEKINLEITPDLTEQELHGLRSISGSYWEGSVTINGRYKNTSVKGKGYVELVGYGKSLKTNSPD